MKEKQNNDIQYFEEIKTLIKDDDGFTNPGIWVMLILTFVLLFGFNKKSTNPTININVEKND